MHTNFINGNAYFDSYDIYDDNNKYVGGYEDHCRGVKQPYFVGWRNDATKNKYDIGKWQSKTFDNKDEAINFALNV